MELIQLHFQLLLNTTTFYVAQEDELKLKSGATIDSSQLSSHPSLLFLKQQQQVAVAAIQAEKAKRLPDLLVGYNIMSMKGTGADNKIYDGAPRFQSVQAGLGIPIFNRGLRARINAAKVNEVIATNDYELNLQNITIAYRSALTDYQKYNSAVNYFERTGLKNAEIITSTANTQFINGQIDYLEYVLLINQAVNIQNDYIEALRNRNSSIVEINSFISN
jgi:cobalt-zinc-cadmium resistance protein CzcA